MWEDTRRWRKRMRDTRNIIRLFLICRCCGGESGRNEWNDNSVRSFRAHSHSHIRYASPARAVSARYLRRIIAGCFMHYRPTQKLTREETDSPLILVLPRNSKFTFDVCVRLRIDRRHRLHREEQEPSRDSSMSFTWNRHYANGTPKAPRSHRMRLGEYLALISTRPRGGNVFSFSIQSYCCVRYKLR